jgi:ribosomal protein S26
MLKSITEQELKKTSMYEALMQADRESFTSARALYAYFPLVDLSRQGTKLRRCFSRIMHHVISKVEEEENKKQEIPLRHF